jgi:Ca2+/Na+ antiporter
MKGPIPRLTRLFIYLACVLMVVGASLGRVYRWELIVCVVSLAVNVWFTTSAFRNAQNAIDIQHETIQGQQRLLKDTISELSRRNAAGNN